MSEAKAILLALAMLTMGTAGCIANEDEFEQQSVDDLDDEPLDARDGWSSPSEPRQYDILPGIEASFASFDDTEISLGVFLPDKPGCDWSSSKLPEECQLPVVIDAGPYWGASEENKSFRPPLVEWLVPRGYAVLHMSVRGTGESGGCMEFMSQAEQQDVNETITWAAEQAWSNGNVGMMGRSYDGTTPLMGAASGNEHLETIVPISGVFSVPDLMFKNGTSETRGPIMHSAIYWGFYGIGATYGPEALDFRAEHWAKQACEQVAVGQAEGAYATGTGDTSAEYWQARDFTDRILENFDGSVWVVHGMQDWNVNPSQAIPFYQAMDQDPDIETKAWLGQWDHAYPDRVDEHRNVRWDWADATLQWFDHYLKDEQPRPDLDVEVEDSLYVWRTEDTYPPRDVEPTTHETDASGVVSDQVSLTWTSEPLDEAIRTAGLPALELTATPTTPQGGWVFAELYDVYPDGVSMRIGWGALNLAYHEGGNAEPATLTPGQPIDTQITFEPVDALVAEDHRLRLELHKSGVEDIPASPDPSPVEVNDVNLVLPQIDRAETLATPTPPGLANATEVR
jgi:predicted acyl esterase